MGGGNILIHNLTEEIGIKGQLHIFEGRVTIDDYLAGKKPLQTIDNLMPTVGRVYALTGSLANIDECCLGSNGGARSASDTDLLTELYSAYPTDKRVVGTTRITELFIGIAEANFTIREFGIKAEDNLISTLIISPEIEKTTAKTYTFIHTMGWGGA